MSFSFLLSKKDVELSPTRSPISRRTLFKHVGGAAAATAFASSLQAFAPIRGAQASGGQPQNTYTNTKDATGGSSGTNIVLVHGAFVDASSWSSVVPLLQHAGHQVLAVHIPLTPLADAFNRTLHALPPPPL